MAGGWDETRRQNGKTQSHEHAQKNAPRTHLPVLGALPRVHSIMPVLFRDALLARLCIERFTIVFHQYHKAQPFLWMSQYGELTEGILS